MHLFGLPGGFRYQNRVPRALLVITDSLKAKNKLSGWISDTCLMNLCRNFGHIFDYFTLFHVMLRYVFVALGWLLIISCICDEISGLT